MEQTWRRRELAVLRALYAMEEAHQPEELTPTVQRLRQSPHHARLRRLDPQKALCLEVATTTGLSRAQVQLTVDRLFHDGYLRTGPRHVNLSGKGLQALGVWPSEQEEMDRLTLVDRLRSIEWMERRIEEVSFVGYHLVKRKIHATVKIRSESADADIVPVPLTRFPFPNIQAPTDPTTGSQFRERVFQVFNAAGEIVPSLSPDERDRTILEALQAGLSKLLKEKPEQLVKAEESLQEAVQESILSQRRKHFGELKKLVDAEHADKELRSFLAVIQVVVEQRLLLIPVQADGKLHTFSFEYPTSANLERVREPALQELAARLGWRPTRFAMSMPGAVFCPAFHAILEAPEGLEIAESNIRITAYSRSKKKSETLGEVSGEGDVTRHQIDLQQKVPAGQTQTTVRFRPRRDGVVRNGFLAGLIVSVMLVGGALCFWAVKHAASQADAAAALLLAVPSFFLFEAARSYEHRIVSDILSGVRLILLVIGLSAFSAAVLIASSDKPSFPLWCVLAFSAVLGTLSLLVAYVRGDLIASTVSRVDKKLAYLQSRPPSLSAMHVEDGRRTGNGLGRG